MTASEVSSTQRKSVFLKATFTLGEGGGASLLFFVSLCSYNVAKLVRSPKEKF